MATEQTITISGTPTVVSGVTVPYANTSDLEIYIGKGKVESIEVTNAGAGYTDRKRASGSDRPRALWFSGGSGGTTTTPTAPSGVYTTVGENNSGRDSGTFDGKYYVSDATDSATYTFPAGSNYTVAPNVGVENFDSGTGAQFTAKIYAKKTSGTDYTLSGTSGNTTITFTSALASGDKVLIKRATGVSTAANTFAVGSAITAEALNKSFDQIRYKVEELPNVTSTAVTNGVKDDISVSGGNWTIVDDAVTTAKIADDAVTSAQLANNIDISGTLDVTGAAIFDSDVNIKGDAKTFTIEKADGTNKFTVQSNTGDTIIAGTLGVTGVTTLTGALAANAGITVDTDKFTVADSTGNTVIDGTLNAKGEVTVDTGIIPDADEGAYLGTAAKPFADAHIGEVRIANSTNDGEIDTASGNLTLDSAGGTVTIDDNATVAGSLTAGGPLILSKVSKDVTGLTTLALHASDNTGSNILNAAYLELSSSSGTPTIATITGGVTGQILFITTTGSNNITFTDVAVGGTAHGFIGGYALDSQYGDTVTFIYNGTQWQRLAPVSHSN